MTERDWSWKSCYGSKTKGFILFLLLCTFLVPSFKNTALLFPEIFFIQYFNIFLATSFPGFSLSFYLEKVPWLWLVTCLCIQIKSAPGVGLTDAIFANARPMSLLSSFNKFFTARESNDRQTFKWMNSIKFIVSLLAKHWTYQTLNKCINAVINVVILPTEKYKSTRRRCRYQVLCKCLSPQRMGWPSNYRWVIQSNSKLPL